MKLQDKVVWSEGMFLKPQHFQQQVRYFEHLIIGRAKMFYPWDWGLVEFALNEHLLKSGKIAIEICRGILPDGTVFDIPGRDNLPLPIDIPEGTHNCIVYLGVALQRLGVPEIFVATSKDKDFRYSPEIVEMDDANLEGTPAPVQIAKLSFRVMLENEDRENFTCLGIAKINEVKSDREIILDENFIPSSLRISASKSLKNFVQEIQGLLYYRGNGLSQRVREGGSGGVAEISDFLLLQVINRYELIFRHFHQKLNKHPQQFYMLLLQLVGELSTFTVQEGRPILVSEYIHHDLEGTFSPVISELRRSLSVVLEENAVSIHLEKQSGSLWIASAFDKALFQKSIFILAVSANIPSESIRQEFPVQVKISSLEEIRNLVNRALPGITLQALPVVPREIPYHANYIYFLLERKHELWKKLNHSAGIAFHVSGEFPGIQLELWAVKDKKCYE
jgi:type VI secretion system protein ImpJ